MASKYRMLFRSRAVTHQNPVARRLFHIADTKRTNLIISADFKDSQSLLRCADALGPYIVALQTNSTLIPDFSDITVNHLKSIAAKHNFLLYETHYVRNDTLRVENWADIIAVSAAGDTLASLVQAIGEPDFAWRGNRAIVAAPEMDVKRAAAIGFFSHDCVEEARENPTYIMGFVAPQGAYNMTRERQDAGTGTSAEDEDFVHLTTIGPEPATQDDHRQLYFPLAHGAVKAGSDFVVVGRDVCASMNPVAAARRCRFEAWDAYESRLPPVRNAWVKKWEFGWVKRPGFGEAVMQYRG